MNKGDEGGFDIVYYLFITISAIFGILNIKRWFKRPIEDNIIESLKSKIFELKGELIKKEKIITKQDKIIKNYESGTRD